MRSRSTFRLRHWQTSVSIAFDDLYENHWDYLENYYGVILGGLYLSKVAENFGLNVTLDMPFETSIRP